MISDSVELESRLREVRQGYYVAFILTHESPYPSLWIHMNRDFAFLHWFLDPDEDHAGFNSTNMAPAGCTDQIFFLQLGAVVPDGFEVPNEFVVSLPAAVKAAKEFLDTKRMPACITWLEL